MSKYTDKQFEDIIMPWWDNLSLNKKEELTIKYFPRFKGQKSQYMRKFLIIEILKSTEYFVSPSRMCHMGMPSHWASQIDITKITDGFHSKV